MTSDAGPSRVKLPATRKAHTHQFHIGSVEGRLVIGTYHDSGKVGEIFIVIDKEGSSLGGAYDSFARLFSYALQYGIPLQELVGKFMHSSFEPQGMTGNESIPIARSVVDYIAKYLAINYLTDDERESIGFSMPNKPTL